MVYSILFFSFVLLFVHSLSSGKENKTTAWIMGSILFLLVALRSESVGPDTWSYVQHFLSPSYQGADKREAEALFQLWQSFWRGFNLNGRLYLIVCAIFSIGLVLLSMWKMSKNRVWSYTLFLVAFSWYFYLTGIRQSLAIGCFAIGTYLLSRNVDNLTLGSYKALFRKENILAFLFLLLSPQFHTTALIGDLMLIIALFSPRNRRQFYLWAVIISFVICLSAVFRNAEQIFQNAFNVVSNEFEIAERYEGYMDEEYLYNTSFYLILKGALPLNFIAIFSLLVSRREYDLHERLFFSFVIMRNIFFYFTYMFRLEMYFYPAACIAVANLLWPSLRGKKFSLQHFLFMIFIVLVAYVNYINLMKQPSYSYHFL